MLYKLRQIVSSSSAQGQGTFGVTIPGEVLLFFKPGTYFSITHSGNQIILQSGANPRPTAEQIKMYQFEGARI